MPTLAKLGAISKWMSDPPPKGPMTPPLQDKYHKNHKNPGYHDENGFGYNLESLRVEDRVNTLTYQPNIDFLRSQNCFALNFQWPSSITLPSMTMSLSPDKDVDIQQIRESAPSGCFVACEKQAYKWLCLCTSCAHSYVHIMCSFLCPQHGLIQGQHVLISMLSLLFSQ